MYKLEVLVMTGRKMMMKKVNLLFSVMSVEEGTFFMVPATFYNLYESIFFMFEISHSFPNYWTNINFEIITRVLNNRH